MNPSVFVFSGPPGCGKGTQIELLFPKSDKTCQIISMSGSLVRLRDDVKLGSSVRKSMDSGDLVHTEIAFPTFTRCWNEREKSSKNIVLDGVIRTRLQADLCLGLICSSGYDIQQIVLLIISVPLDVCAERMKGRGRSDDQKDTVIQTRFDVYRAFTEPAENHLRSLGVTTISINGNQSPDLVEVEARRELRAVCPGF
jgi:adenylate kinase family enzyme